MATAQETGLRRGRARRRAALACGLTLVGCSPRGDDAPTRGAGTPKATPSAESDALRDSASQWKIVPGRSAGALTIESGEARAEILWQDTVIRRRPARLILRGNRSLWQVDRGISLGTSLQELERLNGRPFTLAGFGWDYGGVVTDWRGGTLDSALAGVKLYLDPGPAQYESAPYSQALGDRDYSSSIPAMQQLAPRVAQIFVDFE